jgi:hypothetical protein
MGAPETGIATPATESKRVAESAALSTFETVGFTVVSRRLKTIQSGVYTPANCQRPRDFLPPQRCVPLNGSAVLDRLDCESFHRQRHFAWRSPGNPMILGLFIVLFPRVCFRHACALPAFSLTACMDMACVPGSREYSINRRDMLLILSRRETDFERFFAYSRFA